MKDVIEASWVMTAAELTKLRDDLVEFHARLDRIEARLADPDVEEALKAVQEKREREESGDA